VGTILLIAFIAAYGLYHVGLLRRDTAAAQVSRRNALRLREVQVNLSRQQRELQRRLRGADEQEPGESDKLADSIGGQIRDVFLDVGLPEDEERIHRLLKAYRDYQGEIRAFAQGLDASRGADAVRRAAMSKRFDQLTRQADALSGRIDDVIHVMQQRVREQIGMAERDARAAYTLMFIDGLLAVVMGCTIAFYISRQITNPVHRLVGMAEKIAAGDLHERVSPLTADEIGQLGAAFNRMADELEKSIQAVEDYSRSLEKKVAERTEDLRQSEEKYRSLMENAGDAIFLVDPASGIILEANRRAADLADCPVEKLLGRGFYDFFPPASRDRVERLGTGGGDPDAAPRQYRSEIEDLFLQRDTSGEVPVDVRTTSIPYHGGEVLCSIVRDITVRRELERQVIRTDRMASLGLLAGGVAHELNNPLSSILMNTELVLEVTADDSPSRDDLRRVEEDALRCKRIIEDLLNFARDSRMDRQPVSLDELVGRTLPLVQHQIASQDVQVETRFEPDLPSAYVDQGQMQQVLVNVLLNALQAMPDGGDLVVATHQCAEDGLVEVSVRDSGAGIDPGIRDHIFDPFFTTKDRGTGLGLAICYRIVEAHGGRIEAVDPEAESAPTGACVRISLPCMRQTETDESMTSEPKGTA